MSTFRITTRSSLINETIIIITIISMLTCVDCDSSALVQEEIVLTPHDDRLGGANVVFADKHITTSIMHDVCIKYRCLKCEQPMTYAI